jgi:hypothetical protein
LGLGPWAATLRLKHLNLGEALGSRPFPSYTQALVEQDYVIAPNVNRTLMIEPICKKKKKALNSKSFFSEQK